ncbi:MAG: rod shape-determining protein MreD [Clostridia bacterium]|nr:rod shape-determining protein MreD [Clostridia bacterium]
MKSILSVLTFLVLLIIQTTWDGVLSLFGIMPNILLVYTLLMSFNSTPLKAGIIGAVCGLAFDVSGSGVIGLNAIIIMYTAVIASMSASKFYCENCLVSGGMVFVLTLVSQLLRVLFSSLIYSGFSFWLIAIRYVVPECFMNFVVVLIMFWWVKWLNNRYIRGL